MLYITEEGFLFVCFFKSNMYLEGWCFVLKLIPRTSVSSTYIVHKPIHMVALEEGYLGDFKNNEVVLLLKPGQWNHSICQLSLYDVT